MQLQAALNYLMSKLGTSMATRFTNGVVEFEADNYRFELAGFGITG